jgi:hypothetical protein
MTDKSCPERVRLVERLASALNGKKRINDDPSPSSSTKDAAEQELQDAMDAVRANSAEDLCGAGADNSENAA